jgi:integrase
VRIFSDRIYKRGQAEEITAVSRSFGGTYAARDRALFILGLKSGFRISELLSLRLGDVLQHGCLVQPS